MSAIALPSPPGAASTDGVGGPGSPGASGPGVPLRDRLLGVTVVVVLLAILGGAAGWRVLGEDSVAAAPPATQPRAGGPPTTVAPADAWPAEIQPLAEFVERERGTPFDHPVPVEFLSEDEYQAAAQDESGDPSEADKADLANFEGQLKSLGLLGPDADLDAATAQLYGEGTLAFYDPDADLVKVRGTDLDVAHRVTLVHELTHAWQDQQGYLDDRDDLDDAASFTLRSVVEGDAVRVENAYVDSLSPADQDTYQSQSQDQAANADLGDVPDVLIASFSSLYSLGGPFVSVLYDQGGNGEVDSALAEPPLAEVDLFDPLRYFGGEAPVEVSEPSVPAGGERLDGGEFGAVSWVITLGERIDPRDALATVDVWAGDQSVTYRLNDRVCTAVAYRGETPADTATAVERIKAWAAASPGLDATGESVGPDAVLRSCEPAPGIAGPAVVGRAQIVVQYPALRLEIIDEVLSSGATLEEAVCFGNDVIQNLTVDQMASGAAFDPEVVRRLGDAASAVCVN